MKIIGYGVIVTAVALGVAAALAATWFFLVGGILDLADGRTIAGGLGRIDEWNREYADRWGRTRLGLLKVFVLAPIALVIIALAVRVLLSLGRRLAGSAPKPEAPAPQATEPQGIPAQPETQVAEPELAPTAEVWDHSAHWDVPRLPAAPIPQPPADEAPADAAELPEVVAQPELVDLSSAAAIGDAISLRALTEGGTIVATIRDVVDPVGNLAGVGADRYVAVLLEVHNPGGGTFEDMPTGGSFVIGSDGERYRTGAQKMEPALREIRLEPGDRCEGYLSFKLPAGIRPAAFRFTPNLGLAPDTGEWALGDPAEIV